MRTRATTLAVVITALAGAFATTVSAKNGDGGPATRATLQSPTTLAVAPDGNVLIGDTNANKLRRVAPNGTISTFMTIENPMAIALSGDINHLRIYITDFAHHRVRWFRRDGKAFPLAGTGRGGYSGDGGPATKAQLFYPAGDLATTKGGSLLIADMNNQRIRRVSPKGIITTIAGLTGQPQDCDADGAQCFGGDGGPATSARLALPTGVAVAKDGSVLIADNGNSRVRRVSSSGIITTIAGIDPNLPDYRGLAGDGGPATQAEIGSPSHLAVAQDGSVLISDPLSRRVRRIAPDGIITTIAGPGAPAHLAEPAGLAVTTDGSVLIADPENHRVLRLSRKGKITRFAGKG